ncbi:MAG: SRPBCC domain-containing protein [Microbacterium sp.]
MSATYELHRGFTLRRLLPVPRERVFQAWTDPDHLQWFYNDATPMPTDPIQVNLTVGGAWRQRMVIDRVTTYVTGGIYQEIARPERIAFLWGAVGGWPNLDPARPEDNPLAIVMLDDEADATAATELDFILVLPDHLSADRVKAWRNTGMSAGWSVALDRLVASFVRTAEPQTQAP